MDELEDIILEALGRQPTNTEFTLLQLLGGTWPNGLDPRLAGKWFKHFCKVRLNQRVLLLDKKSNNHQVYIIAER